MQSQQTHDTDCNTINANGKFQIAQIWRQYIKQHYIIYHDYDKRPHTAADLLPVFNGMKKQYVKNMGEKKRRQAKHKIQLVGTGKHQKYIPCQGKDDR